MIGLEVKYFVLNPTSNDPEYANASRQAMVAFSSVISASNPKLGEDLRAWVNRLDDADAAANYSEFQRKKELSDERSHEAGLVLGQRWLNPL